MKKGCKRAVRRQGVCEHHYKDLPSGYVDATKAIERYNLLRASGLTTARIAQLSGINRDTLRRMGTWSAGNVRRETFDRIMAVKIPNKVQSSRVAIDSTGTHRRLQAMSVAGYSLNNIGGMLGVTEQAVSLLLRNTMIEAASAARVRDVFDRLASEDGLRVDSGPSMRARNHARRMGWLPALAWDDPDTDPQPSVVEAKVTFLERYTELREHMGLSEEVIAERFGIKPESLQRRLERWREAS